MNLANLLRAEGCNVHEVGDWRARQRAGTFAPVGVLVHHTAGTNSLRICTYGRRDLPGPLCHILISKDGTCHLISDGVANHAGKGSGVVLNEVRRDIAPSGNAYSRGLTDTIGGNGYFYGIEVENLGNGSDPYPNAQIDALIRCCAALVRHHGWSANRVIHHREWTRRKGDMSYRGDVRSMVRARLDASRPAPAPQPSPSGSVRDRIFHNPTLRNGDSGGHVRIAQGFLLGHALDIVAWTMGGFDKVQAFVDGDFGPRTENVLREWQKRCSPPLGAVGYVDGDDWQWWVGNHPTLQRGDSGPYVAIMQGLMVAHAATPVTIDGDFGPETEASLQAWQGRTGALTPDGICGPKTWAWLAGV